MNLELTIGLDVISSYKRLAYTPWHAIAEFVDNSTQSYFDHRKELDKAFAEDDDKLKVAIVYERDQKGGLMRISDNAMGMSYNELRHALHVAKPPANTSGRSKYGMGLKTASCWIGDLWSIRTKKLGETNEYKVTIDVEKIATAGNNELPVIVKEKSADQHYTIIEITKHNRSFHGIWWIRLFRVENGLK